MSDTNCQTKTPRGLIKVTRRDRTSQIPSCFLSPVPRSKPEPIRTNASTKEPCRFTHKRVAMGRIHIHLLSPSFQCHKAQHIAAKSGYANICGRTDQFILLESPSRIVRSVASFVPVPASRMRVQSKP